MKIEHVLGSAFIAAILIWTIGCEVSIWRECRANGSSFIYCMRMISQ